MATDWAADVKKYDAKADDAVVAGIVKYCGIALRNRDSSLVSFSDKAETERVRNNFLKKKLGLTQPDAALDAAIAKVGERMKGDRTKNRVTVYYLLAAEFKALGQFAKTSPAAKKTPATKAAKPAAPAKAAAAKAPAATKASPAATKAAAPPAKVAAAKPAAKAAVKAPAKAASKPAPTKPAAATNAPAKAATAAKAPAKAAAAPKAPTKAAAPATKASVAPAKKAAAAPARKSATAPAAKPAAAPTNPAPATLTDNASSAIDSAVEAVKNAPVAAIAAAASTAAAVGAAVGGTTDGAAVVTPAATRPGPAAADDGSEMNWLWWVIGLAVLAFLAWWWFSSRNPDATEGNTAEVAASAAASEVGTDLAAAPAENTVPVPQGAGVTSELRDGKPVVKVYFDSGKTDLVPAFANAAGGLKSWLDNHSGTRLEVSGYSDPSGDAAANAELAKQRAQAVQSALVAAGIPATSAALVKPEAAIDSGTAKDAARRVEVVVK